MEYSEEELNIEYQGENINLSYLRWGNAHPETIIAVHGLTRNKRDFDYLAKNLSDKYNIISIDMPGRGKSSWLKNYLLYDFPLYIYCLNKLLEKFKLNQLHWIGSSMGGLLGMMMEGNNPGLIKKFVLNDIGPEVPYESVKKISNYVNIYPSFKNLEEAELFLRKILQSFGIKSKKDWEYVTNNSFSRRDDGLYYQLYDPDLVKRFIEITTHDRDYWAIWQKIRSEILVLRGQRSNVLLKDIALKMKESPHVTLVELAEIGHTPSLMQDEEIKLIKSWLLA